MHIDILTLFPEMFHSYFNTSIIKKAHDRHVFTYDLINFRDYSTNKHGKVDDYPYGGGAGMVLAPQPIFDAIEAVKKKRPKFSSRIILLCPQGETYTQKKAEEFAEEEHLIFICGHYEGYDERIRKLVTDEISIGDYVLTGGELGAMVVVDSVVRLLPDALGNQASAKEDSFSTGLLEHPHYTRPADFRGMKVPDVLLSGDHEKIKIWRKKESLRRTYERRKDLLDRMSLSEQEKKWLQEIQSDNKTKWNS